MKLVYLFDPLCGWCYAATPALTALSSRYGERLEIFASGLFSDSGRVMDAQFIRFVRDNDQRIAQLTGQPFSNAYRENVLKEGVVFNSRQLVNALAAVKNSRPEHWLEALTALQKARYTDGRDTGNKAVVAQVLAENGFQDEALQFDQADNIAGADGWIAQGKAVAERHGLHGVPVLLAEQGGQVAQIDNRRLYQNDGSLFREIERLAESLA